MMSISLPYMESAVRSLHLGGLPPQGEPLTGLPTSTPQPLDAVSQGRGSAAQRSISVSPSAASAPSLAVFIIIICGQSGELACLFVTVVTELQL